jgi:hypothetical protein
MRSSWPARVLLPAAQLLAEGGWLAVVYAALQALAGETPRLGPLELSLLAWIGLGWGRRKRWTGPLAEAVGLPLLALLGGVVGWLLDPQVRSLLLDGRGIEALGTHLPGWIGLLAIWRGETHRSAEDDDVLADQLLRWAVPGLAVPWLIGHLATRGEAEQAFTAAAFMGTLVFVGGAFIAMGLARLEAGRATTGTDWRSNRAWLLLIAGVTLALTVSGVAAASLLGVPSRALLVVLIGPLRLILLLLILLTTPLIMLVAAVTELIGPLLPRSIVIPQIRLPGGFATDPTEVTSDLPGIVFFVIVGLLALGELLVLGFILYLRWKEHQRYRVEGTDAFEERSTVVPATAPPSPPRPSPRPRPKPAATDATGAYLAALDALQRDGRWPRDPAESPAAHAQRARKHGLEGPWLARLAAAYQLARYAQVRMPAREVARAPVRLARLLERLRLS